MALGGTRRDVLSLIVGQGMRIVGAGVAIGFVVALALARLTSSLLFGIGAGDPATLFAVCALMLAVALLACFVPAVRATRLEPASVLRND